MIKYGDIHAVLQPSPEKEEPEELEETTTGPGEGTVSTRNGSGRSGYKSVFSSGFQASREYVRLYGPIPKSGDREGIQAYKEIIGDIEKRMKTGTYDYPDNATVNVYIVSTQRGDKKFIASTDEQVRRIAESSGLEVQGIEQIGEAEVTPRQAYKRIISAYEKSQSDYGEALITYGPALDETMRKHYFGGDFQLPTKDSIPVRTDEGIAFVGTDMVNVLKGLPIYQDAPGDDLDRLGQALGYWTTAREKLEQYARTFLTGPGSLLHPGQVGADEGDLFQEGTPIIRATAEEIALCGQERQGVCYPDEIRTFKITATDGAVVLVEALDKNSAEDKAEGAGYRILSATKVIPPPEGWRTETYIDTPALEKDLGSNRAERLLDDMGISEHRFRQPKGQDPETVNEILDKLEDYKTPDPETREDNYRIAEALNDGAITQPECQYVFGPEATEEATTWANMLDKIDKEGTAQRVRGFAGSFLTASGAYLPKFVTDDADTPESQLYLKLLYEKDQELPGWKQVLGFASGVGKEPDYTWGIYGSRVNPRAGLYSLPPIGGIVPVTGIGPSAVSIKTAIRTLLRKPTTAVTQFTERTPLKFLGRTLPERLGRLGLYRYKPLTTGTGDPVGSWGGRLVRFFPKRGVTPTTRVAKGLTAGEVSSFVETQGISAGMNQYGTRVMERVFGSRAWAGVRPTFAQSLTLKSGFRTGTKIIYKSPTGARLTTTAGRMLEQAHYGGIEYANQIYGKHLVGQVIGTKVQTVFEAIPPKPTREILLASQRMKEIAQQRHEQAIQGFAREYGRPGVLMRQVPRTWDIGGQYQTMTGGVELGGKYYPYTTEARLPWSLRPSRIVVPGQYFTALQRTRLIKQLPEWSTYLEHWPEATTWYRPTAEALQPMPEGPTPADIPPGEVLRGGGWAGTIASTVATADPVTRRYVYNQLAQLDPVTREMVLTAPAKALPEVFPEIVPGRQPLATPLPGPGTAPIVGPRGQIYPEVTIRPEPWQQPAPLPAPGPKASPAPSPMPKPTPEPQPEPLPEPYPEPYPQPSPTPAPAPSPIPTIVTPPGGIPPYQKILFGPGPLSMKKVELPGLGIQVHRQGLFYISVFPPYRTRGNKPDVVYSRKRPPYGKVATGRGSARRSLTTTGRVPKNIALDVGAFIAKTKGGKRLRFDRDRS